MNAIQYVLQYQSEDYHWLGWADGAAGMNPDRALDRFIAEAAE
jgi:hypothetical protein